MRTPAPRWLWTLNRLSAGQRLALAALAGLIVAALCWHAVAATETLLIGWCVFAAVSLLLSALAIVPMNSQRRTRALAASVARNDQSSSAILAVVLLGCAASVSAIGALLATTRGLPSGERWPHGLLALASIMLSWLLIHVRFGFHYAHRDLEIRSAPRGHPPIGFPDTRTPDYLDFMYFSFVIGMTSQVSDAVVNSGAMRRLVLWHSLLSFAFNLLILALAINAIASLAQGG